MPDSNDSNTRAPERKKTDESLRVERTSSDTLMANRQSDVESQADAVLESAREQADAVLEAARDHADRKVSSPSTTEESRALEDERVQEQRDAADEIVRQQREERARTLAALLPLERETTDRHLVTERARSDAALALRDDFLGMVTHDLGNLLSGIFVNATLLAEKASDSEEGRRTVAATPSIHRYVARMNRLIKDLVDVASIDGGTFVMRPRRRDAVALARNAVATFAQTAKDKGVHLSLHAQTGDAEILADFDPDRMMQVRANLIANALKFTGRGGVVALRVEREGAALRFSVVDTGSGIHASLLEAVFQRFWQVGKNDERGFGLGLYLSRCIVNAHGGRIWVESTVGAGSAFYVTLPLTTTLASTSVTGSSPVPA
jgi:signal transduction histidine kinase